MKAARAKTLSGFLGCAFAFSISHLALAQVVIGFDDRPGYKGNSAQGQSIPPAYLVHDEYLPLGVRFDSAGGGIGIMYAINSVSPTNVAVATEPGPIVSFNEPIRATFFSNGLPAVVDMVALTLTSASGNSTMKALDQNGVRLGYTSDGAGRTLQLSYTGSIHSIELDQGSFAFDNFTFAGLAVKGPALNISRTTTNLILSWATGALQQADAPQGTFTDVVGASSPYPVAPTSVGQKFYRVRVPVP